jgi:uncharacterized protein (TIGR02118 family)
MAVRISYHSAFLAPLLHAGRPMKGAQGGTMNANAHLLVMYPIPKDPKAFDRAYRDEHLPFASARLPGALSVVSKRVAAAPGDSPRYYAISDITFPSLAKLQETAGSTRAKEALEHAASISSGGPPTILVITDDLA